MEIYESGDIPTNPAIVNRETPLDSLNLNWGEKELPEKERTKHVHRLHPYLGKYIPQLVEVFLRKYFSVGQRVFDPFSGSGTTLVQCNELGINSIGCDISGFNVMLTRAKTKAYSVKVVSQEIEDILKRVQILVNDKLIYETKSEYLKRWFASSSLMELLAFRSLIPDYEDQDILKVILSRAARSARLTTHYDLDFPKKPQTDPYKCYKHSRICHPTEHAIQFLIRYGKDTINRIEQFSKIRTDAKVEIIHGNSRDINIGLIDGIITSPPYIGLIDYHDQHRYAYELLGIEDRSSEEIGAAKRGKSSKECINYQELVIEVFNNAIKYMSKGGYIVVVAGDRNNLYPDIAAACKVSEGAVIKRHVNRRTGRRSGEFYESIFVWRK